jgi:hypothetical protein
MGDHFIVSALLTNALVNKAGIFVLAAMSLYFGFRLISDIELQKLLSGDTVTASFGRNLKIAASKLVPGSIFVIMAAVMVMVAYKSEIQLEQRADSIVARGLGPGIDARNPARAEAKAAIDTVLGILNTPSTQFSEADIQALRATRPELEKLSAALASANPQ